MATSVLTEPISGRDISIRRASHSSDTNWAARRSEERQVETNEVGYCSAEAQFCIRVPGIGLFHLFIYLLLGRNPGSMKTSYVLSLLFCVALVSG